MSAAVIAEKRAELQAARAELAQLESEAKSAAHVSSAKLQAAYACRDEMQAALQNSVAARDEQAKLERWRALITQCSESPEQWASLQDELSAAKEEYDSAAQRRRDEEQAFRSDPIHTEIKELERERQDRQQRVVEQQRRVHQLVNDIRLQRGMLAEIRAAEIEYCAAATRLSTQRSAICRQLEARLPDLIAARDKAQAALNQPIGA
ncbi:MAG TPA: hypothetical protein VMG10_27430 [Gemmataceae bacterium]|nr:hypothetical protein [Gemmataceae bacterium]